MEKLIYSVLRKIMGVAPLVTEQDALDIVRSEYDKGNWLWNNSVEIENTLTTIKIIVDPYLRDGRTTFVIDVRSGKILDTKPF